MQGPPVGMLKGTCDIFILKDCPIANQYSPELHRIISKYTPKGIQFFLMFEDPDATSRTMAEYHKAYGFACPSTIDPKHVLAKKYGITTSPSVVVYNLGKVYYAGRIDNLYANIAQRRPKATTHDLRDALDEFLAGEPVKTPRTQAVGCRLY